MPWKEQTAMTQRQQFVRLVAAGEDTIGQLCREFGICRSTAYKWLARYGQEGVLALFADSTNSERSGENLTASRNSWAASSTFSCSKKAHPRL